MYSGAMQVWSKRYVFVGVESKKWEMFTWAMRGLVAFGKLLKQ